MPNHSAADHPPSGLHERGSVTVASAAIAAVVLLVTVAGLALASAVAAAHRARTAADLSSLAAAVAVQRGADPGIACTSAAWVAQRNGAHLTGCSAGAAHSVTVVAEAPMGLALPGHRAVMAKARARAGPSP